MRILYVEDNDDNTYMLKMRLERQGIDVLVPRDGLAAIETARLARPDLILMDSGPSRPRRVGSGKAAQG